MDRTPDHPAPPLHRSGEPKWISLRQAAAEWARCGDRDENHYLDAMIASFWLGDFERDGVPKVFTFEVPEAYAKIHKKAEVEARLGPRLASYLRLDDRALPLDEVGWVLNPQEDNDVLPIVVHEEQIGGCIMLFPEYHLDRSGELWITTVDDAGRPYDVSSDNRDTVYYNRRSLLTMLIAVREIRDHGISLDDNPISIHIMQSLYDILAKKPWVTYSSRGAVILARLHIFMADLEDWAREKRLAFPFQQQPRKSSRLIKAPRVARTAINKELCDYRKKAGSAATLTAAVRHVQERHPGASRDRIREQWRQLVPEHQRRSGRKSKTAR